MKTTKENNKKEVFVYTLTAIENGKLVYSRIEKVFENKENAVKYVAKFFRAQKSVWPGCSTHIILKTNDTRIIALETANKTYEKRYQLKRMTLE